MSNIPLNHVAELTPELWGWVRNGLQAIKERTGERWLPEDIYCALKSKAGHLYTIGDVGFLIAYQHADTDGPVLFIAQMWTEPGAGRPIERELYRAIDGLAASIKAKRVRMHSPRDAWRTRGYFEAVSTVYERELT